VNQAVQDAVERLAAVLEAENAALAHSAFNRVGELADEKRAALAALNVLPAEPVDNSTSVVDSDGQALAMRLQRAADENKQLLEQAITVQNRIMAVLAGAARQAQVPLGYGAKGHRPRSAVANAVALIVRA